MEANKMNKNYLIFLALVAVCVLVSGGLLQAAVAPQSADAAKQTYSWPGELVALDENARTITVKVKSWVVGKEDIEQLGNFKAGERIMLTWSGLDNYSSGINRAVRQDGAKFEDRFMFPAEFVSFDAQQQYVTFKTRVPANGIAALKSLKPGEWVTATSPHGRSSQTEPIVAIKPFAETSPKTSN
jgi:hypothetical protein